MNRHYYTGLIDADKSLPETTYHGRGWTASLVTPNPAYAKNAQGKEIRIEASKSANAQRALDLVWAIHCLMHGAVDLDDPLIRTADEPPVGDPDNPLPKNFFSFYSTFEMREACELAARASRRRDMVYAIALFHQSKKLHWNHPMDLEPRQFPYRQRSTLPRDHVRFAQAIVLSYAVLEQLGLEVRSSSVNPISTGDGKWNPVVRDELIVRLRKLSIDVDEDVLWIVRGPRTRLERTGKRLLPSQKTASCSRGVIRDCMVPMIDAIADLRWLRNCISAHKVRELAELLSVHDVANAQNLAARLILELLGCWGN